MADPDLIRHTTLWKDDGSIVVQVGETLFKLHRSVLSAESKVFSGMFDAVAPDTDGTEEKPLVLEQVSATVFANLITIIYTVWVEKDSALSTEEYMDVLRLAHKLHFFNVHRVVLDLLPSRLTIEQRLHLAMSHTGVDEWGAAAFEQLVYAIDLEERGDGSDLLESDVWSKVYRTRLRVLKARVGETFCSTTHGRLDKHIWRPKSDGPYEIYVKCCCKAPSEPILVQNSWTEILALI
ncbi:hypothetical protein BKA62DRAFT_644122 [Auriculariales sp. MPI-PUGE-AT-0066]|nr:hypothetical protein BKA62DRAFT_644122 [Auriculariales sp. MPI-PUGE-AT-0066]